MRVLTIASHLAVSMLYVTAMMGTVGRSLETRRAVLPLVVNAMMALDLEISATYRAETEEQRKAEEGEGGEKKRAVRGSGRVARSRGSI